jgi:hypothetical protein
VGRGRGERYAACRVHISAVAGSNQTQTATGERESGRRMQLSWAWAAFGLVWSGMDWLGWVGWIGLGVLKPTVKRVQCRCVCLYGYKMHTGI